MINARRIDEDLLQQLPHAAVTLFAVFSRFECALKRSGYHYGDGDAKPNWEKFAAALGPDFFDEVRNQGIAQVLIDNPPKKQVVQNGYVDWQPATQATNTTELFVYIRRVRNNLFHGGKYPSGPVRDMSRDQELLLQSVAVLELALRHVPDVAAYFADHL